MRTTLAIDDDVLEVAKSLAHTRHISIGEVISELARKGIYAPVSTCRDPKTGWLMFDVALEKKIDLGDVQQALDDDDLRYANSFRNP